MSNFAGERHNASVPLFTQNHRHTGVVPFTKTRLDSVRQTVLASPQSRHLHPDTDMMTRLALTLLTFALSTVAHAGPISWIYTVPTVSVNFPGLRKYEVFGVDNQQMQSDYGDLHRVYLHRGATWDVHPPLVGQTVPYVEYNLRFIITDVASGQSGQFMMPSFLSVHQGWSLFVTSYAPRDTALVLGRNEYRLYNSGSPRDDRPYEIGIVTVKPLITSVPDPARWPSLPLVSPDWD